MSRDRVTAATWQSTDPAGAGFVAGSVGTVDNVHCYIGSDGVTVVEIETDPGAELDPPDIRVYVNDGETYRYQDAKALYDIAEAMSGRRWSADTAAQIAEILAAAGYDIEGPTP